MEFETVRVGLDKPSPSEEVLGRELGGFDFDLCFRNARMTAGLPASKLPKAHKTGTTICGITFAGGVVLGADTRATEGTIVCDKNCEKIHYIAPNIYCCGAGTSADTENTTRMVSSKLELLRLATGAQSRVVTSMTMLKRYLFRYQGHVSAALVLGGADATGSHLYTVYPHGSTDKLPFVSMGSGSLAAMAVLEAGFRDDMTEEDAIALVTAAIRAGIFNDLGSGSNVDITVIRQKPDAAAGKPQVTILRNYQKPNEVEEIRRSFTRPAGRQIPKGATAVVKEMFQKHVTVREIARPAGGVGGSNAAAGAMDLS